MREIRENVHFSPNISRRPSHKSVRLTETNDTILKQAWKGWQTLKILSIYIDECSNGVGLKIEEIYEGK